MGVPQGGIISPLLSNLVLHELDSYMEKCIANLEVISKGLKPYLTNPEYHKYTMRINRLKKKIEEKKASGIKFEQERAEYVELVKTRRKMKSLIPNPAVTRIKYVRYADD